MTGSQACSSHRLRVGRSPRMRRRNPGPRAGTAPAPQAAPQPTWTALTRRGGQALDELHVVNLTAIIRVIPVQPRLPRVGRVGVSQPERTVRSNRLRATDCAQEPVPGLTAADRAAHRITPDPGRDGVLAPRGQPGHARTPDFPIAPDSNGDSNSSNQRQAAATVGST
jgi:hypothetical protein